MEENPFDERKKLMHQLDAGKLDVAAWEALIHVFKKLCYFACAKDLQDRLTHYVEKWNPMTMSRAMRQAAQESGMIGGVLAAPPPVMGQLLKRVDELMEEAGLCGHCGRLIENCICSELEVLDEDKNRVG